MWALGHDNAINFQSSLADAEAMRREHLLRTFRGIENEKGGTLALMRGRLRNEWCVRDGDLGDRRVEERLYVSTQSKITWEIGAK